MVSADDLMRLYRDDDHTPVRCVGGPCDGQTLTWSTSEPPPMIRLVVEEAPAAAVLGLTNKPPIAHYGQALDRQGSPRRDDDGTLVYTYRCME
ncbi:hypothetical protein [Streptomyces luteocolor]|uniref:hypothetical protein n=1 Tax=Streptomyces luteocolor TaxID=285500 RepID=UPI0009A06B3A|nr:hypothetical protein [Streptomyces luteocolor]